MRSTTTLRIAVLTTVMSFLISCGGTPSREESLQATVSVLQTQVAGQSAPAPTSDPTADTASSPQPPAATEPPPATTQPQPATVAPTTVPQEPAVVLVPMEITKSPSETKGAGWSDVTIQFAAENRGGKPFYGYWPGEVTLKVKESFTYPLRRKVGVDQAALVVIPPGFRIVAPPYIATIGETTSPETAVFDKTSVSLTQQFITGEVRLDNPVGSLSFPTDLSSSELTPLPDVIEMPDEARLTVEGFPATQSMYVASGGVFAGATQDVMLMDITLENLNAGQNLKLSLIVGVYDAKGVAIRDGAYLVTEDGKCGPAGNSAIFGAGPGQTVKRQLCIPEGQTTPFADTLSLDGLKVMVWVHPSVYALYGNPTNNETWRMYDAAQTRAAEGQTAQATALSESAPSPISVTAESATIEIPAPGAPATLPLHILARVGQPGEQVVALLRWQDGTELTRPFTTVRGEDGHGLLLTSLDWMTESQPPQPETQPAILEIRNVTGGVLAQQSVTILSANDPTTKEVTLYWFLGDTLQPLQRRIPKTERIGTAALEELLWGPGPNNPAGFTTALPTPEEVLTFSGRTVDWGPRVTLRKLTIENGVATADFSMELTAYGGGAERVRRIREQITQTLKQFPTVQAVLIAIDGQTDGVLEP